MMLHKIIHSIDYNWNVLALNLINQLIKFIKSSQSCQGKERKKKYYYKTLGTSVMNSPLSPLSLSLVFIIMTSCSSWIRHWNQICLTDWCTFKYAVFTSAIKELRDCNLPTALAYKSYQPPSIFCFIIPKVFG